jgi:hypothetical protein
VLDIRVELTGADEAGRELRRIPRDALQSCLGIIVQKSHREALRLLSGPGRTPARSRRYRGRQATRAGGQFDMLGGKPGSYPVPRLTGNLARLLDFVKPGQVKVARGIVFRARQDEAILFNAAQYANVIHQGTGSSARFGKRPFLTDGFRKVPSQRVLEQEIRRRAG